MNNRKIVIIAVLIVLLLVNSLGCDNRGELTKEETINLLYEIQGNSYRDTIEDTRITFRVSDLSQDDQLLLLNASFGAFCSNSDYDSLSGRWFSSKRYCRTCIWYCNYSVEYSGSVFEIHEVSVSKYRDGKLYIVVRYYDNKDTSLEKSLEAEVSP